MTLLLNFSHTNVSLLTLIPTIIIGELILLGFIHTNVTF
jgi:hypothetical protein